MTAALVEQQPGDEEAGEDEEDVDADAAAGEPGRAGVEEHDRQHREAADAVQRGGSCLR